MDGRVGVTESLQRQADVAGIVIDQQDIHALSAIKTAVLYVSICPTRLEYRKQTACDTYVVGAEC
jgi:hypothetical protein